MVAKPYTALTTAQLSGALPPLNSVWGQQYYTMGTTHTQTHILLQTLVLSHTILRLKFSSNMQGRLDTLDYTAATSATSQPQRSTTTCTCICHQPTKLVKTSQPLTSVLRRLTARASHFFVALLVEPFPLVLLPLLQLKNQTTAQE